MAISLGGIMRGALPVLSQRIAEDKPQNTEDRLNKVGELFTNLAPDYEQKVAAAQEETKKINSLVEMTGIPEDVAYDLLKKYKGDILKAEQDADKLLKTYKDSKKIPVVKLEKTSLKSDDDTVNSVNISSDKKGKQNIISNFSQLFKFHTQDEIIEMFSEQNNLSPEKVKSIIFQTFKLPSYAPTTKLATEAYGAIRDYKEEEPVDKLKGIKLNVDFLKGLLSSEDSMQRLKNQQTDVTLITEIVKTYNNLIQKQEEVGVGNLKAEDLDMMNTLLDAVPTDIIQLPVPPEKEIDVSKMLSGYKTRVDGVIKLTQEELEFENMDKNQALQIQNQITPLYGNIQDKLQNKENYADSEEYTNDLFKLDNLLSKLEGDRQIVPDPKIASVYVDKTSNKISSILGDLRTNKDKYPNADAAIEALTNYEKFLLDEKDKPVGDRNIGKIKEIYGDISSNKIFDRTKSAEEIKAIFRRDYNALYSTATNLRSIARDTASIDYYSAAQINQMKQFEIQFEQIIRENFDDKEALEQAMTSLSEDMFLISPTTPAVPVAKQFEYLDSLVTNFIGNRNKYNEEVQKEFPMLLANLNEIKNMTDSEEQRTAFLNFEKQTIGILRGTAPKLSGEMLAIQNTAKMLTENSITPDKSKFYRDSDLNTMKSLQTRFAIIAALPDGKDKSKQLAELQDDMKAITTGDPDVIAKEKLIQSQTTRKLTQEELTKLANTAIGIDNADIKMIDNILHIVVPSAIPGGLPTHQPLARINDVGEQIADNPKVYRSAVEGMESSLGHIKGIADLKSALEAEPNAFNVIGKLYMAATDFGDFIGKPEVAEFFGGANIQKTVSKRIEFVKTVKDQIFDDPRLSDQDLRLIIQYIAVLNDPSIGVSRAVSALNSLEQVMVNSVAKNMFIAKPGLKVTNGRGPNYEYLDAYDTNTIGGRTFRALFNRAHPNFKIPNSKEEFDKMSKEDRIFFATRGTVFALQAENAVGSVNSLATYILKAGGDVNKGLDTYNKQHAYNVGNKGTFNPNSIIKGNPANKTSTQLIESLVGTMDKEQVEKLKARLGENFGIG